MITWRMQMMLERYQIQWRNPASLSIMTEERSMKVSIEYYVQWNYKRRAALAAQLQKTFNSETSLIKGGVGDFDVYVDNVLIFSKWKEGCFPNEGEVERLIKNQSWSGFLS